MEKGAGGKLLVNVCINPLTTLLHVRNGALIQNPSYEYMMKCAFEEAVSILELSLKKSDLGLRHHCLREYG
ncbi:ketopantoate reductase C-terminal domain-containing protein [Bacillus sp. SL00103]